MDSTHVIVAVGSAAAGALFKPIGRALTRIFSRGVSSNGYAGHKPLTLAEIEKVVEMQVEAGVARIKEEFTRSQTTVIATLERIEKTADRTADGTTRLVAIAETVLQMIRRGD